MKRNILKKKKVRVSLTVILLICLMFQGYIWWIPVMTEAKTSDAIIVLGCQLHGEIPSAFLRERTLKAAQLYKQNKGKYIIVSGGQGPGETISEAEGMKRILLQEGIPESSIILEDKSRNTNENIKNSKQILDKMNLKSVIVVSNDFHLRRAKVLCDKNNLSASYSGVFVKQYIFKEVYGAIREMPGIIKDILFN